MPAQTTISVIILVKAAPVLTADADEQMCVAGMRLDRPGEWVRLFPVPFRDLDDEAKFKKYQEIAVDVIQPQADRRPESMTPIRGSISLGEVIDTRDRWARRRRRVAQLPERTMCELVEMNRNQPTEDAPSLGVVRLAGPHSFASSNATTSRSTAGSNALARRPRSRRSSMILSPRSLSTSSRGASCTATGASLTTATGTTRRSSTGSRSRYTDALDGGQTGRS